MYCNMRISKAGLNFFFLDKFDKTYHVNSDLPQCQELCLDRKYEMFRSQVVK